MVGCSGLGPANMKSKLFTVIDPTRALIRVPSVIPDAKPGLTPSAKGTARHQVIDGSRGLQIDSPDPVQSQHVLRCMAQISLHVGQENHNHGC